MIQGAAKQAQYAQDALDAFLAMPENANKTKEQLEQMPAYTELSLAAEKAKLNLTQQVFGRSRDFMDQFRSKMFRAQPGSKWRPIALGERDVHGAHGGVVIDTKTGMPMQGTAKAGENTIQSRIARNLRDAAQGQSEARQIHGKPMKPIAGSKTFMGGDVATKPGETGIGAGSASIIADTTTTPIVRVDAPAVNVTVQIGTPGWDVRVEKIIKEYSDKQGLMTNPH